MLQRLKREGDMATQLAKYALHIPTCFFLTLVEILKAYTTPA
jgi:hypothetical protein